MFPMKVWDVEQGSESFRAQCARLLFFPSGKLSALEGAQRELGNMASERGDAADSFSPVWGEMSEPQTQKESGDSPNVLSGLSSPSSLYLSDTEDPPLPHLRHLCYMLLSLAIDWNLPALKWMSLSSVAQYTAWTPQASAECSCIYIKF